MIHHVETLFSGTAIASGNTQASPVITKYDKEAQIFLDITAVSGTNPTLNITIQTYSSLRNKWHTLATFSQKTGTGQDAGFIEYAIGEAIAISYVIGGTTPSFTFTIDVGLKNR